jgi:membrane fusion protein (multidrug efflux system)
VLFLLRSEEQDALLLEARAQQRLAQDVYDRTQRLTNQDVSSLARRLESSAKLDQAKARVALAELEVQRTRIRAPFDGVTGQRLVSVGDRVDEKVGMVTVASVDRLQLHFSITEQAAGLARTGVPILVRVGAWPGEQFPGEVYFISPSIDAGSRRLLLKAWIPNAEHKLKPGMFANVDVVIAERDDALLVPESALIYDRNGTYLWRVDDQDRAEKIPIEIGLRQAGEVEILKGVVAGDRIVSAGTNKVRAGGEIDAVAPQTAVTSESVSPEAGEPREGET